MAAETTTAAVTALAAEEKTWMDMKAHGPGGIYNIFTIVFAMISVVGLLFAILAATNTPLPGTTPTEKVDPFRIISALLLCFIAMPCAVAAASHEQLSKDVSKVEIQNRFFEDQNKKLDSQLASLGDVREKLSELQKNMGVDAAMLGEMLASVRKVTCTTELATVLRAFLEADGGYGNKDRILQANELGEFFDNCDTIIKEADPTLDFVEFKNLARKHGLDLYRVRCIVCAVIANCDASSGRSAAMMGLVMFSLDPEKYFEALGSKLKIVFADEKNELAVLKTLEEMRSSAQPGKCLTGVMLEKLRELSSDIMSTAY
eukprot:TRINITY_DN60441_c0_g1_i1.p1 TRINITY_DN60441_c0_g1~~TRINITY_DN60441_c0_g1_i1.p1  ORF type:complete len:317 (+),score=80.84 TRINITY_DN60441_c0_g1_i1:116-1066(+)